jgi:ribosomal protein L18
MKKVQREKAVIIAEINAHLSNWKDGNNALSKAANINYHAARRALKGGIKNNSKLFISFCTLFEVEPFIVDKVQNTTLEKLTEMLRETWDGSEPHAALLHSLIKSTKPFKVQGRRK